VASTELNDYFRYKCLKGLEKRGLADKPGYRERLDFEIETINKMGFPGYFLIFRDIINWARENGIYVGPGRGSAAGALSSFCLGITNLDPIRWNLLFERFLNPDRISMPDIDVDFEERYRDRVIEHVAEKYGAERVAHIGTFGKQRAKAAVRAVTKLFGHPYKVGDELAKLLLEPISGKPQPLATSFKKVAQLHAYRASNSTQGEILKWAEKIEDHIGNVGVHASGVVISNHSLLEEVPLFLDKDGEVVTQWEMNNIEEVGLIKFDFLGLDALTKIHTCVDLVKEHHGVEIDIDEIDLEDKLTFENLRKGDSVGIFQLEATGGMRDLLIQIRPTSVEDLIALVAIYRPGPLDSDYKQTYLDVRAGKRDPEYLVPELDSILGRTDGWLIYQEQIMEICKKLCGYTGGEADSMRKAVGKKIPKLMAEHEPKFKKGWTDGGLPKKLASVMWDDIVGFAAYGFNRSHAASYAMITYQTAYLKAHYPAEFMCACMNSDAGDKDQMIKLIAECKELGIKILPPDVNKSRESFYIDNGDIRFGLGPIKNLGVSPVQQLIAERDRRPFKDLRDFCERVDLGTVNRKKLESLILSGAFDKLGANRATMVAAVEAIWEYRDLVKRYESKMETYTKKIDEVVERLEEIAAGKLSPKGKKLKPKKTLPRPEEPSWPEILVQDEMSKHDLQVAEHELLGFYVSSHPMDNFTALRGQNFLPIEFVKKTKHKTNVTTAAVVTSINVITTKKKKQKMAFVTLEDLTGSLEGVLFSGIYEKYKEDLKEGSVFMIDGNVEVTEADESRTTKLILWRLGPVTHKVQRPETIDVVIKATRLGEFFKLLEKYSGDLHAVRVTIESQDGTRLRSSKKAKIGNFKSAFQGEVIKINNGET
jgi:DNA polymerase-3 subunit alpha